MGRCEPGGARASKNSCYAATSYFATLSLELSSARKAIQPKGDRLIASLLKAGLIEIYEEGWSAEDPDFQVYLNSISRKKDKEDI